MSRYVKEFADDTMLEGEYIKRCPEAGEMNDKIRRIVELHDKGVITNFEAVELIVKAKRRSEEISATKELWMQCGRFDEIISKFLSISYLMSAGQ